jgi:hypothetical protein
MLLFLQPLTHFLLPSDRTTFLREWWVCDRFHQNLSQILSYVHCRIVSRSGSVGWVSDGVHDDQCSISGWEQGIQSRLCVDSGWAPHTVSYLVVTGFRSPEVKCLLVMTDRLPHLLPRLINRSYTFSPEAPPWRVGKQLYLPLPWNCAL